MYKCLRLSLSIYLCASVNVCVLIKRIQLADRHVSARETYLHLVYDNELAHECT